MKNAELTIDQIFLIKKTWKIFRGIDPAVVGDTFYSKLFAGNQSVRRMFPRNMHQQYTKLMDMLNTIVAKLDKPEELETDVVELAKLHVGYGVRPAHYKLAGDALLWTLEHGLGKDWTPEIGKAWLDGYNRVARMMIDASTPAGHIK